MERVPLTDEWEGRLKATKALLDTADQEALFWGRHAKQIRTNFNAMHQTCALEHGLEDEVAAGKAHFDDETFEILVEKDGPEIIESDIQVREDLEITPEMLMELKKKMAEAAI